MRENKNELFAGLKRLFEYIKPYKFKALGAAWCTVFNHAFDLLPDIFLGMAVDVVVNKSGSFLAELGIRSVQVQLLLLGFLTLIFWLLESVCEYLSELLWRNLAQSVQHDLRLQAYRHVQSIEMAYFENQNTGDLLTILNDDVNQLDYFFDKAITHSIYFLVNVSVVGSIFVYCCPAIAVCVFFPIPLILLVAYQFQKQLGGLYLSMREHAGVLGARISNNLLGIATIKSCATEEYELNRLADDSSKFKAINSVLIGVRASFIPIIRVVVACGVVATIVVGGWYVLQKKLAVGVYTILISMTQRLLWPFIYLAKITDIYKKTMASVKRIFTILDRPIEIKDGTQEAPIESICGNIEFKNISFSYPSGVQIFNNLSLCIKQGQMIGLVGSTGSGKTTLIKLLLRFYDPDQGDILLDGFSIKDLKLPFLRQFFGFVSQDVFLFKGSIRENIMYGSPLVTHEDVIQASRMAEIHDFIMSLPDGYDTMIGEYGQKLSGGQKQRISIARALVNKPPIFIFDEATSSVDNETEMLIQRSLKNIAQKHTIFVIAHRLSSVRNADNIFVFQDGKMVENGRHEALIEHNGVYAKLWSIQTGQYE